MSRLVVVVSSTLAVLSVLALCMFYSSDSYAVLTMGPLSREYFYNSVQRAHSLRGRQQMLASVDSVIHTESPSITPDGHNVLRMGPLTREMLNSGPRASPPQLNKINGRQQMLSSLSSGNFYASEDNHLVKSSRLPEDRPDHASMSDRKASVQSLVQDVVGDDGDFASAAHWDSNRLPQDRRQKPAAWSKAAPLTALPFKEVVKDCQGDSSCGPLLGHRITKVLRAAHRRRLGAIRDSDEDRKQEEQRMAADYSQASKSGEDSDVSASRWQKLQQLLNSRTPPRSVSPVKQQAWQLSQGYNSEADLIAGPARPDYDGQLRRDSAYMRAMPSMRAKLLAVQKTARKDKAPAAVQEQLSALLRRSDAVARRVDTAPAPADVGKLAAEELSSYDAGLPQRRPWQQQLQLQQQRQEMQQQQPPQLEQQPQLQQQPPQPQLQQQQKYVPPAAARGVAQGARPAAAPTLGDFALKTATAAAPDEDTFDREVECWQTGRGCSALIKAA